MATDTILLPQKLTLNERKDLHMTGVTDIVSFDDTAVVVETELGTLEIQGDGLQLKTLSIDGGQIAVSGHISSLFYQDPRPAGGFWSHFLK